MDNIYNTVFMCPGLGTREPGGKTIMVRPGGGLSGKNRKTEWGTAITGHKTQNSGLRSVTVSSHGSRFFPLIQILLFDSGISHLIVLTG
jgi:hypothetical protein